MPPRPRGRPGGVLLLLSLQLWLALSVSLAAASSQLRSSLEEETSTPRCDFTVVAVTDAHGWVAGHRHERKFSGDLSDVVGFVQVLKRKKASFPNLVFVENGDFVDGGGLSDAGRPRGKRLFALLSSDSVGFSARTIGNHEMYHEPVLRSLLDMNHGRLPREFVTSNLFLSGGPATPLGSSFLRIPLENCPAVGGAAPSLLVFGFLYDMQQVAPSARLTFAKEIVAQAWFAEALTSPGAAGALLLCHMDYKHPIVTEVLLPAIRKLKGSDFPVVFITGHTHLRRSAKLDPHALTFEPGKYLDTVGVVRVVAGALASSTYVSTNRASLATFAEVHEEELVTPETQRVSQALAEARSELGLDLVVGELDRRLFLYLPPKLALGSQSRGANEGPDPSMKPSRTTASLWGFYLDNVAPGTVLHPKGTTCPGFLVTGAGSMRYDFFPGRVTVDDVWGAAPFTDVFVVIRCVSGRLLHRALRSESNELEALKSVFVQRWPLDFFVGAEIGLFPRVVWAPRTGPESEMYYDVVVDPFVASDVRAALYRVAGKDPETDSDWLQIEPFRADAPVSLHSSWMEYLRATRPSEILAATA